MLRRLHRALRALAGFLWNPSDAEVPADRPLPSTRRKRHSYGDIIYADGRYWYVIIDAGTHLEVVRRLVGPAAITHIRADEVEDAPESPEL